MLTPRLIRKMTNRQLRLLHGPFTLTYVPLYVSSFFIIIIYICLKVSFIFNSVSKFIRFTASSPFVLLQCYYYYIVRSHTCQRHIANCFHFVSERPCVGSPNTTSVAETFICKSSCYKLFPLIRIPILYIQVLI